MNLKKILNKIDDFSEYFVKNVQPLKSSDIIISLVLFLTVFSTLAIFCPQSCINGDAAVYQQQMKNLDFAKRTAHLGYFVLGSGLIRIFPGSADYILNIANCFLGAVLASLLYLITVKIIRRSLTAVITVLFLLTNYLFIENSVYSEVYTPQVCFMLLSIFCWLSKKPILAGFSLAVGCLMTPTAIFLLPFLVILRPAPKAVLYLVSAFCIFFFAAISTYWNAYFFGSRGVLTVMGQQTNWSYILQREANELLRGALLVIPFMILGLFRILTKKELIPFGIALIAIWLVSLIFGEKNLSDWAVQFPTYIILYITAAIGLQMFFSTSPQSWPEFILKASVLILLAIISVLLKTSKTHANIAHFLPNWLILSVAIFSAISFCAAILLKIKKINTLIIPISAAVIVIAVNSSFAFTKIHQFNKYNDSYRDEMIKLGKTNLPHYVLIGHWSQYILFEHYVFNDSYTKNCTRIDTMDLANRAGKEKQQTAQKLLGQAVGSKKSIFVLGKYSSLLKFLQQRHYKIYGLNHTYIASPEKITVPRK